MLEYCGSPCFGRSSWPEAQSTNGCKAMRCDAQMQMEPSVANGSVHPRRKQQQRNCSRPVWIGLEMTLSDLISVVAQRRKEEAARKEREKVHSMLSRQLELHVKSRSLQYPCEYKVCLRLGLNLVSAHQHDFVFPCSGKLSLSGMPFTGSFGVSSIIL